MRGGFELFDHTADIGVRVRAATLAELVAPAADGLYAVIGDLVVDERAATTSRRLEYTGNDAALLLQDFLSELLFAFECAHSKALRFADIAFSTTRLSVEATFAPVDLERSSLAREVKAVTYHALSVKTAGDGCEAEFIVDV